MNANGTWRKSIRDTRLQIATDAIARRLDFDMKMTRWHWHNDGIADFAADILVREAREVAELADKCATITIDGKRYRVSAQNAEEWIQEERNREEWR